jgi:hypothetical protein
MLTANSQKYTYRIPGQTFAMNQNKVFDVTVEGKAGEGLFMGVTLAFSTKCPY